MKKTVYILGAGFSRQAGAPTQAEIIDYAFKLYEECPNNYNKEYFFKFKNFIEEQLNIPSNEFSNIDLEDIFTPLDRCTAERSQFRGVNLSHIMEVREAVVYVIGMTIQLLLNGSYDSKDYIDRFASYITSKCSVRAGLNYRLQDPVSIVSTNWDILLDNSIYETLRNNQGYNGVVDYCCYISAKNESDESVKSVKSGLEKLGQGGFNVKLLKLHGSLNWLQCPRCSRLYANFGYKEAINNYKNPTSCRHCDDNFPEHSGKHTLMANLIMPTYLKDLSNPQYRIIWQNAGIEISEASEIVFIGYSLPHADFELRQLLSRMTRKSARITVVDSRKVDEQDMVKAHWRKFFGSREIEFDFSGASAFVARLIREANDSIADAAEPTAL
ncbi:hypothetical protein [Microbulbifer sp. YPW16]|uniref:hypothetical protein n=1 Tax=Microbulbifer sp. YPW16 TaxID=2904242 RepID=UPI001E4A9A3B|nr:hypothetical protein [Microbulbifer sp. YPW16]UHQ54142.1 hypothetical protein LVE68_11495 [Microbulbifer sp. YPW16]